MKIVLKKNTTKLSSDKEKIILEVSTSFDEIHKAILTKLLIAISFFFGISFISEFWKYLEQQIYGEVQQRVVDDIIFFMWIVFVICSYIVGYQLGKRKKEKQTDVHT